MLHDSNDRVSTEVAQGLVIIWRQRIINQSDDIGPFLGATKCNVITTKLMHVSLLLRLIALGHKLFHCTRIALKHICGTAWAFCNAALCQHKYNVSTACHVRIRIMVMVYIPSFRFKPSSWLSCTFMP